MKADVSKFWPPCGVLTGDFPQVKSHKPHSWMFLFFQMSTPSQFLPIFSCFPLSSERHFLGFVWSLSVGELDQFKRLYHARLKFATLPFELTVGRGHWVALFQGLTESTHCFFSSHFSPSLQSGVMLCTLRSWREFFSVSLISFSKFWVPLDIWN